VNVHCIAHYVGMAVPELHMTECALYHDLSSKADRGDNLIVN